MIHFEQLTRRRKVRPKQRKRQYPPDLTILYRQRYLVRDNEILVAKHRRKELEHQHESALRLGEQKQEMELQKFQQEQQWLHLEKEPFHQD